MKTKVLTTMTAVTAKYYCQLLELAPCFVECRTYPVTAPDRDVVIGGHGVDHRVGVEGIISLLERIHDCGRTGSSTCLLDYDLRRYSYYSVTEGEAK